MRTFQFFFLCYLKFDYIFKLKGFDYLKISYIYKFSLNILYLHSNCFYFLDKRGFYWFFFNFFIDFKSFITLKFQFDINHTIIFIHIHILNLYNFIYFYWILKFLYFISWKLSSWRKTLNLYCFQNRKLIKESTVYNGSNTFKVR